VLEDFNETPAFGFAERPGFHDTDAIADLGLVLFVVSMELGNVLGDFAKLRVWNACDRANDNGFVHFIGHNLADTNLSERADFGCFGSGYFCHDWLFLGGFSGLAAEDGFDAGNIATCDTNKVRFLELAALLLDAEVENFLLQLALAGEKFFRGEFLDFLNLHGVVS
jgi:hypothetical protein